MRGSWRRSESLSCMKERISLVRPGWKFLIFPLGMWYFDPWRSICRKLFSPWEQEDGGGEFSEKVLCVGGERWPVGLPVISVAGGAEISWGNREPSPQTDEYW